MKLARESSGPECPMAEMWEETGTAGDKQGFSQVGKDKKDFLN